MKEPLRTRLQPLTERLLSLAGAGADNAALDPAALFDARPVTLYVHIPFCRSFCAYCVFNKERPRGQEEAYVDALVQEIAAWARQPALQSGPVGSIYFGGGTPSALPAADIARILDAVRGAFTLELAAQVTLEANPESLDAEKLERYQAAGVNRLSVGVQSFDEAQLKRLGRCHRRRDIQRALTLCAEAGFEELSIDLMYGLPGQGQGALMADLEQAIAAPVSHLSLFPMIYRKDTTLWSGRVERGPLYDLYAAALDRLSGAGFVQYTPEDFTRGGAPCRYQVDAWDPASPRLLGLGAGALSMVGARHWYNIGDLDSYVTACGGDQPPVAEARINGIGQQRLDYLMRSAKHLRFDPADFRRRFGRPLWSVVGPLPWLWRVGGLLRAESDGSYSLTRRGSFEVALQWGELILGKLARASASKGPSQS